MPYIKEGDKTKLTFARPGNPGELNYMLTMICKQYLEDNGGRYQQVNDIVGALECCKLEFYRRKAAPYEDTKIIENGDVY
jgi:hypothetical protein